MRHLYLDVYQLIAHEKLFSRFAANNLLRVLLWHFNLTVSFLTNRQVPQIISQKQTHKSKIIIHLVLILYSLVLYFPSGRPTGATVTAQQPVHLFRRHIDVRLVVVVAAGFVLLLLQLLVDEVGI